MSFDLGDVVPLLFTLVDVDGNVANATTVSVTVTLPDASTASGGTVTSSTTGSYEATYFPTAAGRHLVRWVATGTATGSYTDAFDVVDPADVPVVSLADAKAHLNITTTVYDEELRRFLGAATEMCESWVGRPLRRRTVSETHDGGRTVLLLRQVPVISVTSVVEDGTTVSDYALDADNGLLYRDDTGAATWAGERQDVTVAYVAGWTAPPADVQQAVLEALRHLWTTQRGGMDARTPFSGDEYASGTGWSLPRRVMELLQPYLLKGV